ncbi:MAG: winged helix-turn-helix domain-containing protein, partial [Thermoanaerobaculia bacterium]|nr:winged helix-turn-helix domain-containing protein [Thermoanaerobaculia bacterium]
MRLRFGDFVLDFERRQLLRGAQPVEMSPKAFQLLSLLVKKRPRALGKDEILESLWPGTFVSEGNLASLVNEIRHALGEKGRDSGSIRTVHGFGYAFGREAMAEPEEEVRVRAVAPRHRLVWGQRVILLSEGENLMGR